LFSFSWNNAFQALHVITNDILSVFPLNFLFGVFGHCRTSWRERNVFIVKSVLQDLYVCLYLCQEFHPKCLEYTLPHQDQISVCFSSYPNYISSFCLIIMLLPGSYISVDDVSSNAPTRPLSAGSPSFSPYLALCYKPNSQNLFKHSLCYGHVVVSVWCISG
jgi:hypothetical protein